MLFKVSIRLCYQLNYHKKLEFFIPFSVVLWYILKISNEF